MKYVKCKTCDSLKIYIEDLHETLRKFTKCRDILDMILFSQRNTYNKRGLDYLSKSIWRNLIIYAMRISLLNVKNFNVIIAINVVMLFYLFIFC